MINKKIIALNWATKQIKVWKLIRKDLIDFNPDYRASPIPFFLIGICGYMLCGSFWFGIEHRLTSKIFNTTVGLLVYIFIDCKVLANYEGKTIKAMYQARLSYIDSTYKKLNKRKHALRTLARNPYQLGNEAEGARLIQQSYLVEQKRMALYVP